MTKIETQVVKARRTAASDLGFRFTTPFTAATSTGEIFEALGLVHQFGSRAGTLISVAGEPFAEVKYPTGMGYYESCLSCFLYRKYNREVWMEMLNDWGWHGPPADAPSWYSGEQWTE